MTVVDPVSAAPVARELLAPAIDLRGELLERVFELFDRENVAYCVLHGYAELPGHVRGDVDLCMDRRMLPRRLAALLRANEAKLGARVVQWFEDRARFIVLARTDMPADAPPVLLQLHISTDFELCNRVLYHGEQILATRQLPAPPQRTFSIPAPWLEFGGVLANGLVKRKMDEKRAAQLSSLWTSDPIRCGEQAAKLLGGGGADMVSAAAGRSAWGAVRSHLPALRRRMLLRTTAARPLSYLIRVAGRQARRIGRWLNPQSGLHVVFLGPDGVGKSTVIDAVRAQVADAFLVNNYATFARGLLPTRPKASPHALPPRSLAESAIKAVWWAVCYTAGYYISIYPTIARGGLMINHRYLIDAVVDPKRYRYSGPQRWVRAIWKIAPKPDLLVFLDAPAEVIQQRKQEVTLEEARRQRDAYRALARQLPNAHVVDTSQSIEKTIAQVSELILTSMAQRAARQGRRL